MNAICATIAPDTNAADWLASWRETGGGTTIALDGTVHVWWLPGDPLTHPPAQALLAQLDDQPELRTAVRGAVLSEAMQKAG